MSDLAEPHVGQGPGGFLGRLETVPARRSFPRRAIRADQRRATRLVANAGRPAVVWLAVLVPVAASGPVTPRSLVGVTIMAAIWLATLSRAFTADLRAIGVALPAMIGTASGLVAVAALSSLLPDLRLQVLTAAGLALGVFVSAATWEWCVQQTSIGRCRVLFVGRRPVAEALTREITRSTPRRFELVGCVEGRFGSSDGPASQQRLDMLSAIVEEQRPDLVVLADKHVYSHAVDRLLDISRQGPGFRVVGLSTFFEYALGRVPVHQVTPAWFMAVLHLHQRPYARWSKRTFDLAVAFAGLVVALPLVPFVALAVLATGRPLLYRQTRVGEGGREFTVYKFRTMVCDAEAPGCPRWADDDDDRVTGVGRVLRHTHLDELPQLWNVFTGDMSIVGPRPERPEFVATLEDAVPFWTRRLLVKPGVTGWAQIRAGYAADCESAARKLSYDLWYIRHRRLGIDIAVCLKTAVMLLRSLLPRRSSEPAVAD